MIKKSSTTAEAEQEGRGPGQPEHAPSIEQRKLVEVLAQYGVKHKSIAVQVGVSLMTLRKHYLTELMMGDSKVQGLVGQTALRLALGSAAEYYPPGHPSAGKLSKAEVPPSERLLEFFLKTRLGLVPHIGGELDPFGKPEDVEFNTAGMTNKERVERMAGLFEKVAERIRRAPEQPAATVPGSEALN